MYSLIALLILFTILSLTDLALTHQLVGHNPDHEANPIASYIITHYSFEGLIIYKLLIMMMVISAILATWERQRKSLAQKVAFFGCLIMGSVVAYSLGMFHFF